ncbi:MAG: undecaprenyl/decaprenyl-phosphate alpha-N-acetylglucosaminyl 1-phosphate transferase [Streptosporangiales bacterium]|nr:undecaprenyl/decaprenyl-phosphate alpha-N-acetylglucosaminyl 1-phosphate transferase [Streptosporangiales bacterium]
MREYLLTLLMAAVATYLLTSVVRRVAIAMGAVTQVRDRDVHAVPTPSLGGLAMYGGLAAALLMTSELPRLKIVFEDSTWIAVLVGGGLITLIGLVDDRFGMSALTKFAGQVAAAGILVLGGVRLLWLPLPAGPLALSQEQGAVLTVALIVTTINAVNFIDGLDGLAAGIVGIAALAFFSYSYLLSVVEGFERMTDSTLITAILTGMCAGFLPHNFNPARIFMGDTGAMLIGLLLSASAVSLTGQFDTSALTPLDQFPTVLPLLVPIAVMAVPFIDLLLAVVRRTRAGKSPFAPDKQHLHHRLLRIGHSHARAVLIMYFWAALVAFSAVAVAIVGIPLVVFAVSASIGLVALIVMAMPRLRARRASARRSSRPGRAGGPSPEGPRAG